MTDKNKNLCEKILGNIIETVAVDYDNQTIYKLIVYKTGKK